MKIKTIKIDDIVVKKQIRTVFNPDSLKSLAASIKEKGVLQPILVKQFGDEYKIVAGERRFLASQEAGLKEIPACILDDTDNEKEIQLIENTQREDLNPLDLSCAFKDLRDAGKTLEEIAELTGKTHRHIIEILSLSELPEGDKEKIKNGEPYTKFTRQKIVKNTGIINNNDNLNENNMTDRNVNTVHITSSNKETQETKQNQELNENNITNGNMNGVLTEDIKTPDRNPEAGIHIVSDNAVQKPNPGYPESAEDQKPTTPSPAVLRDIKALPEEVLKTETAYPEYFGMPKEIIEPDEDEESVEISPESLVNEAGQMIDLQNRPVTETEEGYAVVIEPYDVKELIAKFNEGDYGLKINLGAQDVLILIDIDGTKNIYNVINCLANNVKDYINV